MPRWVKFVLAITAIIASFGLSMLSAPVKDFLFYRVIEELDYAEVAQLSNSGKAKVANFQETTVDTTAPLEQWKIYPSDDTTLSQAAKKVNNGDKNIIEVKASAEQNKRAVIQFTVSENELRPMTAGGTATLYLYVCGIPDDTTVEVRPFAADNTTWNEMSVTWYGNGDIGWRLAGGALGEPVIADFSISAADAETWVEVPFSVDRFRSLATDQSGSYSLMLVMAGEAGHVKFKSKETTTDKKPFISFY